MCHEIFTVYSASLISKTYAFGNFRLSTGDRRLYRSTGEEVALTPRVFDLLLLLVESDGRLLTKDEILDAIWPDTIVEESNLTQNIFVLRKVLGESTQIRSSSAPFRRKGTDLSARCMSWTTLLDRREMRNHRGTLRRCRYRCQRRIR